MTLEQWFLAAQQNDASFLRQHLDEFAGRRDALFGDKTALMYAAQGDHLEAARVLYPREKRLQSQNGSAALHFAASRGHRRLVELLASAERDLRNARGQTAEEVAREKGLAGVLGGFAAGTPEVSLRPSRQADPAGLGLSRDPDFDQQRQIGALVQTQRRLQTRLREERLRRQQMLEKVRQVEGDMRRDLEVVDEAGIIAERVGCDCERPDLLQGELEALRREVQRLGRVAAKVCAFLEQPRAGPDQFCP